MKMEIINRDLDEKQKQSRDRMSHLSSTERRNNHWFLPRPTLDLAQNYEVPMP